MAKHTITVAWFEETQEYLATPGQAGDVQPPDRLLFSVSRDIRTESDRQAFLNTFYAECRKHKVLPGQIENLDYDTLSGRSTRLASR